MKYRAKDASNAIEAGTYQASIKAVISAKDDGSPLRDKNGYDMLKIVYDVYVGDRTRAFTEYQSASPVSLWRYAKLADALGARAEFKAETFDVSDYIGRNLILELTVQDSEQYGEQNRVKSYGQVGTPKTEPAQTKSSSNRPIPSIVHDDDIPF